MQLSDSQTGLVAAQLALAGLTLGLGVDQTLAWWRERAASLRWMALTSFALVAVLGSNVGVVASPANSSGELALFVLAVARSAAGVLAACFGSSVGSLQAPRLVPPLV